ncbi:MAG: hypothetical protein HY272_02000 [Gammaproteobacteria bacterium]|nr:hypothetical protein [Gammaproteobacteria bacterium]
MLMLGAPKQEVKWPEAGITLELIPLPEDVDQKLVRETVIEVRDDKGKLTDVKRDVTRYAQLVGKHCIKGWSGVVNAEREPAACTPDAIDQFMLIDVAQTFVFGKVKGLALHLANEVDDAKNA